MINGYVYKNVVKIGSNEIYAWLSYLKENTIFCKKNGNYTVILIYGTCATVTVTVGTFAAGTVAVHTRTHGIGNGMLPLNGRKQGREIYCFPHQRTPFMDAGTEYDLWQSQVIAPPR